MCLMLKIKQMVGAKVLRATEVGASQAFTSVLHTLSF